MPGPVSDSYDPEFGTGHNAGLVRDAVLTVRKRLDALLGSELRDIVQVAEEMDDPPKRDPIKVIRVDFPERELRIIRWCLNRELEAL